MVDLISRKNYFFAASIIVIIIGIVFLFVNGLQLDIQFQGGTLIQIEMTDDNYDTAKVEELLKNAVNKNISVQKLQTYNPENASDMLDILMLKVSKENTLSDEEINIVTGVLKENFNVKNTDEIQVEKVAPFIGEEMMEKGIQAIVIASVLIVLYVWWRFSVMSGLSAALFAVLALLHDALIMFTVYTVFKIPVNEAFIAAVLTILGYSMNDTIIIYDRIRENSRLLGRTQLKELVNKSILQTLSRSINTTLTVLLCIVTVYVYASIYNIQSLKDFSLPLTVGLASGAYSSIFIASPLWMMWKQYKTKKVVRTKKA